MGHDTASRMHRLPCLLLQVSYLDRSCCPRSSNRCFLMVSCPSELFLMFERCKNWFRMYTNSLLLLLSGDVESNPGPNTNEVLTTVLATVQRIDSRQEEILNDLRALKLWQTSVDDELKQISSRMHAVEVDVMALKQNDGSSTSLSQTSGVNICEKIKAIESRCEDAENRLRRSNLLFFGLPDEPSESWFSSEQKVIQLCSQHLGITLQSSQVERAHRLGRYNSDKCRPIITKFAFFKDKHSIMEMGHKLKGTLFAIREDFAPQTRFARKKLLEFGKAKNVPFKLSVDKLRIDNVTYVYDAINDKITPASQ